MTKISYSLSPLAKFWTKKSRKSGSYLFIFQEFGLLLFTKHVVLLLKNADERGAFG